MSHVIDTLNGALRDLAFGIDAMRWTPEPEPALSADPPAPVPVGTEES